MDLSKITRFEVIDHTKDGEGRVFIAHNIKVEASVQDDGKTLKIFLNDYDYLMHDSRNCWPYLDRVPDPAKDAPLSGIYRQKDPINNNSNTPPV